MGMKANKKHGMVENGKFYVGGRMNRRKNGRGKIGTTENALITRVRKIRYNGEKDFEILAYVVLEKATKARIELIESWVREGLEHKYTHVGNDHFDFSMTDRETGYNQFVNDAITLATEMCNMKHWNYKVVYNK